MKIAIVTINDPIPNYGNRLQNYAVNKVLKDMGLAPVTLYVEKQNVLKNKLKRIVNIITRYHFSRNAEYSKLKYIKQNKFRNFNNKYIKSRRIRNFHYLDKQYDYFVLGSDQVWNPSWYDENKKKAYLLTFAKPEQKVCFAPSFGIDQLPEVWSGYFKEKLNLFHNISVREESGALLVEELTGKRAIVLIDPTLMLDVQDWRKIESQPQKISKEDQFILTYFIGEYSKEQKEYIKDISSKYHMKIYNLLDPSQQELFSADPGEFVWLINHAKVVFTDSYHGCVFSFLYNKPFQVFERVDHEKNMMSRIHTFLNTFHLQERIYGKNTVNLFDYNYSNGYEQLEYQRKKVITYLKKELSLK